MKTGNLLLILFAIALAAMIIIIYNKKHKGATIGTAETTPGFETISYKLPTDTAPIVFGPKYWAAFHDLTSRVPCGTCREFAEKFMVFFHDTVNLKLSKPLFDPVNFSEMSQLITMINLKGNKWPE